MAQSVISDVSYLQQVQPQSQLSPEHELSQEQAVSHLSVPQHEPLHFALVEELLIAYNAPEAAITTNDVNKMIFFFMIFLFVF